MDNLELRASVFAAVKHGEAGQVRKYTGEPYICHPASVASLVRVVDHTPEMLAAAWLHDTIEDTNTTADELREEFGRDVADLVVMLTDVSKPGDGNRAIRKALDRAHIAEASPAAKTIKLADLIDNTDSICAHDPDFSAVYLAEKRSLLGVLEEGDATLWAAADLIVSRHGF